MDGRRGWIVELRADLGDDAARRLCEFAGGQRRHIPQGGTRRNWVAQAAGEAAARWLAERFAGEYLCIPLAQTQQRRRAEELRAAIAAHPDLTASALARKLGVNYRTVERIRKAGCVLPPASRPASRAPRHQRDPRQMSLL